jgi:hypothetical protein
MAHLRNKDIESIALTERHEHFESVSKPLHLVADSSSGSFIRNGAVAEP